MRISLIILSFTLLIGVAYNQSSFAVDSGLPATVANTGAAEPITQDPDRLERQKQLPAIVATFRKHTSPERAHKLAYLCYETTIGTPFKPIDLAEIALAETGGHRLSNRAVSTEGALGVWQLMPQRAISHGYSPAEMKQDEKCATAAVKELKEKLKRADGNMNLAKRLYCGTGSQAQAYALKTRMYRRQILTKMASLEAQAAKGA